MMKKLSKDLMMDVEEGGYVTIKETLPTHQVDPQSDLIYPKKKKARNLSPVSEPMFDVFETNRIVKPIDLMSAVKKEDKQAFDALLQQSIDMDDVALAIEVVRQKEGANALVDYML